MEQRIVTRAALISLICLISLRAKSSETAEIFDFRKSHEIKPAFRRRPYRGENRRTNGAARVSARAIFRT